MYIYLNLNIKYQILTLRGFPFENLIYYAPKMEKFIEPEI